MDSLLALDPISTLLEPLVEQVYALSATNHPIRSSVRRNSSGWS
ncbi:hypothetical protein [Bradyrhizobium sp. CCGUVB1N3]|nr:hypothetical protein [Bradyrhizobium sp. CCGUVB1N3]